MNSLEETNSLEDIIYQMIQKQMETWEQQLLDDMYVLSFYIECEDDDPRQPRLVFGYNTESQVQNSLSDASDPAEARWNYAFWLQNEEIVIGDSYDDEASETLPLRDQWVKSLPLYYTDELEAADFNRAMELGNQIVANFYELVKGVIQRLHDRGDVQRVFGRIVPLLIHELEYNDEIAEMNTAINPVGSVREFVAWIDSM